MKTGPTNLYLRQLIVQIKKHAKANDANIWRDVAERLEKSRRQRVEVNIADIARHANKGETIVVPGKVLAAGNLTKPVSVAAWKFSEDADKKIKAAKGEAISIEELMKKNPKGSNVRIMT